MRVLVIFCAFFLLICTVFGENVETNGKEDVSEELQSIGRSLVEQGRTFVHHAVKRFMIILPAIFFKLGIAFTILLLVAIAVLNNGFIGFLLLIVGLSNVLARLQQPNVKSAVSVLPYPYLSPTPTVHTYHGWDRSDQNTESTETSAASTTKYAYSPSTYQYSNQYANQYSNGNALNNYGYYARYGYAKQ